MTLEKLEGFLVTVGNDKERRELDDVFSNSWEWVLLSPEHYNPWNPDAPSTWLVKHVKEVA